MFGNYKVIAATPAGRRKYLELLLPYILRDRGLIDEYHLWVNTFNESDVTYIKHLESCFPDFIRLIWSNIPPNENATVDHFYSNCVSTKTLYIKIDDRICFIESGALHNLLTFRTQHPEYFLVSANIVNHAICSYIHRKLGIIGDGAGELNYDPLAEVGWQSSRIAARIHQEFIGHWENSSLRRYRYYQWVLNEFEPIAINFVCWFGEEFAKFVGHIENQDNDEAWLSVTKPKQMNQPNAICGEALVSYFAYDPQIKFLETYTKCLNIYRRISYDTAKQNDLSKELEFIGLSTENTKNELISTELAGYLSKIRNADLEQLQNPEWIENNLLIELGLNGENLKEFPEYLHSYCGHGLKSWQYPKQFSKYLVWLSQQGIRSYLEIGCLHGGTFIITVEYLERFGNLDIAVGIDPFSSELMQNYAASKNNVSYLKLPSWNSAVHDILNDIKFDLVFIDADHSEEGVNYDYNLVRNNAKFIAFHNIVDVNCPSVVKLWRLLKIQYFYNFEFVDQYDSLADQGCNYLGIGVIDTKCYSSCRVIIHPVMDNDHRPFWSVMIPTYNCANFLVETLKSVLAQDPGIEEMQIEVVDDCSTKDDPEAIVREIGQGRVSFFRQPKNGGATANFNTCIERAKGQWVHILHGDDTVLPGFYSSLRTGIEQDSTIGAAITRYMHVDEKGNWIRLSYLERETPGPIWDYWQTLGCISHVMTPCIVVNRSVYERIGGFNTELIHAADWEMWRRISAYYPYWFEPAALACYREHPASDTSRLIRTGANILDVSKSIEIAESYLPQPIVTELSNRAREINTDLAFDIVTQMLNKRDLYAAACQIQAGLKCCDSPRILSKLASILTESEDLLKLTLRLFITADANQFFTENTTNSQAKPLVEFNSREINLIAFPNWQMLEAGLYDDLTCLIRIILTSPQSSKISLLLENSQVSEEEVNLIIADIIFHLLQQEDLDIEEEPVISLLNDLDNQQWKFVLDQIYAMVILPNQNEKIIHQSGTDKILNLPLPELASYIENKLNSQV
jgi:glycosyltransferase involved in cell wall biosynthesis